MLLAFTCTLPSLIFSQSPADSILSTRRYFSYNYSNDLFNNTDRYFTQEIQPSLVLKAFRKLPLMKLLPKLKNAVMQYGLLATQDCFTPASIRRDTILKGDRPYSGTIYLGHFKIANDEKKKQRLTSEIDLGAIGPCAVCEEEQKAVHKALNNIQPLGWQFQIANDAYLNYRMRYDKNLLAGRFTDLTALAEVNAGTIYDNAALGANLRVGRMQGYFDNLRSEKFQLYGFVQGWAKAVGYNATLQGGLFSKSINTLTQSQVAPVVLRATFGATLSYKYLSIEYGRIFITREVNTWWDHGWGYINITTWF